MARDFIDIATEDRAAADALLRETPGLATSGPFHALILGDTAAVARALDDGTLHANAAAGPLTMPPLAYACLSRYAQRDSPRAAAIVDTARLLLARGADVNADVGLAAYPGNPFRCLYFASGYNDNPALTQLLLDAGAAVDDGESVYHSTEHADFACLRLLLARGPRVDEHVLKHMLDRESVEGVGALLDAGADPAGTNGRGEASLHWAVRRDRSPEVLRLLLAHGAPIDARRLDGRTAYALAVLFGRDAAASTLRDAGADTTLSDVDRYVAACAAAEAAGAALAPPPPVSAADANLLPDLAGTGRIAGARALLAAGVPTNSTGEHAATALHFACWGGADDLVTALLARGADTTVADRTFTATPGGWLIHGAQWCDAPHGDYAAALRAMLAAGAAIPANGPTGRAEVDAILRERGLLQ